MEKHFLNESNYLTYDGNKYLLVAAKDQEILGIYDNIDIINYSEGFFNVLINVSGNYKEKSIDDILSGEIDFNGKPINSFSLLKSNAKVINRNMELGAIINTARNYLSEYLKKDYKTNLKL